MGTSYETMLVACDFDAVVRAVFAPFAAGPPGLDRIAMALRGEASPDDGTFAERHHRSIMRSLGLPSAALTDGFRHLNPVRFPGAVHVLG